ncbi:MAG: nicotinate-nucleotide--dimethylbenzimidazole phosphoribosyltransferase, partial [Clostridia bacterium]
MQNEMLLRQTLAKITPRNVQAESEARARLDALAKPPGSLGRLEDIAAQLSGIAGGVPTVARRTILIFSADNGVVEEGVASAPKAVTVAQTINFTRGVTGVAVLARRFGAQLRVIDIGIDANLDCPGVIDAKVRRGTGNIACEDAMTRTEAMQAVAVGIRQAQMASETCDILGLGEMGIGNTTTSSAVLSALTGLDPDALVGKGAGLAPGAFDHKKQVVRRALTRSQPDATDPVGVMQKVGGLDIAGMAGAYLGAAAARKPVVIDGFISAVAALCAVRLCPDAAAYMIPSHASREPGYA